MIYGLVFLYFAIGIVTAICFAYKDSEGVFTQRPPSIMVIFIWPFLLLGYGLLSMDKWIDSLGHKLHERMKQNAKKDI